MTYSPNVVCPPYLWSLVWAGQAPSSTGSVHGHDGGVGQMTSRSGGPDHGAGHRANPPPATTAPLLLDTHLHDHNLIVRPVGELTPKTYEQLRDGLLQLAAEEPAAIVIDLTSLHTTTTSLLMVFSTVHDRINHWPGVPLVLAAPPPPLRTLLDAAAVTRFVPTHPTVTEALQALHAAPCRCRRQIPLPYHPANARLARRLVEQTCHQWGIPDLAPEAVIIASELTDNMVSHAHSDGWLRLELHHNTLTIAVADAEPRPPRLRIPDLHTTGGRGLVLVDKLSRTWGSAPRPDGKVVWATLTTRTRTHCTRPTTTLTTAAS